jgi:hypothetical protein
MSFDYNIENYTRNDLIEMFELPSNFDKESIELNEQKLIANIINNIQINNHIKIKTINFISKAKSILLNGNKSETKTRQKNTGIGSSTANTHDTKNTSTNGMETPSLGEIAKELQGKMHDLLDRLDYYNFRTTPLEDPNEHMVQTRPKSQYVFSYPNDYYAGVINPLRKLTIKKNLVIDSRFRDNYYSTSSSNFNINLPLNIENVLELRLNSIELPATFYAISKQYGNNFFTITVALNDGSVSTTVINIPSGNYIQTDIMDIINKQLSLAGAPFSYVAFIINLTGALTGSGQTMVGTNPAVTASNTVTYIELNFQADRNGLEDRNTPLPLKFGWILGFRNGIYTGNLNYVSEGVVDLTGPKYLYLVVDDYNNNVVNRFYSAFNSSILNKNILARISLSATYYSILNQDNLNLVTSAREYFGPVNLQTMNIQILDEYGRIVDLNNMDFSFSLLMTTVYDVP